VARITTAILCAHLNPDLNLVGSSQYGMQLVTLKPQATHAIHLWIWLARCEYGEKTSFGSPTRRIETRWAQSRSQLGDGPTRWSGSDRRQNRYQINATSGDGNQPACVMLPESLRKR
jgi:hypothetical protein